MPIGEFIAEAVAQIGIEAGAHTIKHRYGLIGCLVVLAIIVAIVVGAWWYFIG